MAKTQSLCTRVPVTWLEEIEQLIAKKFPHYTRSEWLHGVVEHELIRQRDGKNKDGRLDKILEIVERIDQHTQPDS